MNSKIITIKKARRILKLRRIAIQNHSLTHSTDNIVRTINFNIDTASHGINHVNQPLKLHGNTQRSSPRINIRNPVSEQLMKQHSIVDQRLYQIAPQSIVEIKFSQEINKSENNISFKKSKSHHTTELSTNYYVPLSTWNNLLGSNAGLHDIITSAQHESINESTLGTAIRSAKLIELMQLLRFEIVKMLVVTNKLVDNNIPSQSKK